MVAVVDGVKIDSEQFPATHRSVTKIRSKCFKSKFPIEDALQECMLYEEQNKKLNLSDPNIQDSYILKKLTCLMTNEWNRYRQSLDSLDARTEAMENSDNYSSEFITLNKEKLYNKLFSDEVKSILFNLQGMEKEIAAARIDEPEESWSAIYNKTFRNTVSKSTFFNKVNDIRETCTRLTEEALCY